MREESLDIGYIKDIFMRRKHILIGAVGISLILAILFIRITPPLYEAQSKILIVINIPTVVGPNLYAGREEQVVNNEIEMITSRRFMERVVKRIRSDNKTLRLLEAKDPALALLKTVVVRRFGESDIITIKARAYSPQDAAYLANVIAEEYIKYSTEFASSEIKLIREFLERQIPITEKKLKEAEDALKNFKKKYGIIHLSEETKLLAQNLRELDNLYNENLVEYLTLKEKMQYLHKELSRYRKELAENFGEVLNPFFKSLREELIKLETELTMYKLQGLKEDHPKIMKLKQRIEETKELMKQKIKEIVLPEDVRGDPLDYTLKLTEEIVDGEIALAEREAKKEAIERVKKQYEERMKKLPDLEVELAKLEREYSLTENMYKMLSEKYEEVKIQEAGKIGNVRIVDTAYPPSKPIRPKKRLTLILALFGGFIIGMAGVSFVELLDTTIKIEKDIEIITDIPVVGTIPLIGKKKRTRDEAEDISERLITHFQPKSYVAEAFRSLRTNIQYMLADEKNKVILVTSSIPWEGKSTVVVNLGIALAQSGKKTLLIDTDLRKPVICKIFEQDGCEEGITDVMINNVPLKERIMKTSIQNLSILPAGEIPANPSELLESQKMENIMEEVKKRFEFIILDSPPMVVTDPFILAKYVNLLLLVVRSYSTRREILEASVSRIESFDVKKGIVLNRIPLEKPGGYYSYYYYGKYGHYYTREERK